MLQLQNATFQRPGELIVRSGFQSLGQTAPNADLITNGAALAAINNELLLFDGITAYSYVAGTGWITKGTLPSALATDNQIVANGYQQNAPDCAVNSQQLAIFSWLDARGGVRCSVQSLVTGTTLIADASLDPFATCTRCVIFGTTLVALYSEGQDLKYQPVLASSPTVLQPEQKLLAGLLSDTDGYFDVAVQASTGNVAISWSSGGSTSVRVFSPAFAAIVAFTGFIGQVCGSFFSTDGTLWIAVNNSGTLSVTQLNVASNYIIGTVTFAPNPNTLGQVVFVDYSSGVVQVFCDVNPGQGPLTSSIITATAQVGGITQTLKTWLLGVQLASKSFVYSQQPFVAVQRQSTFQATLFVVTTGTNPRIVARDLPGGLGEPAFDSVLPAVNSLSPSEFLLATCAGGAPIVVTGIVNSTSTTSGQFAQINSVNSVTLDFAAETSFFNCQVDGTGYVIGAGGMQLYDGVQFTEQGFYLWPEGVEVVSYDGPGPGPGVYQYQICYAWIDAQGNVARSQPSTPGTEITLETEQTVVLQIPTLTVTNRPAQTVWIEVYRTQANGTSLSLVTSQLNPTYNNPAVPFITFNDTVSDLTAQSTLPLYTAGGNVYAYTPAPSCGLCCTYGDRIWLAKLSDTGTQLAYSNLHVPGTALQFNQTGLLQVDSLGGPITALGTINQQLIIFKENCTFYTQGGGPAQGPDPTNQYGTPYPNPIILAANVGCTDPNSIVVTPAGMMFKSKRGIYLIDNSNGVSYIGAQVEAYNDLTITSANVSLDNTQVRFTTLEAPLNVPNQGLMLVYDYFTQQWSVYTGLNAVDAVTWNDSYVLLKSNGDPWQELEGSYVDPYGFYGFLVETNEIAPFGPGGLFRPYEVWLYGTYFNTNTVRCSFSFNSSPWMEQVKNIQATAVFDQNPYGQDSPYGAGVSGSYIGQDNTYGDLWREFMLCFRPYTRCHTMRIRVENIQSVYPPNSTNTAGEGFSLSAIRMKVGNYSRGPLVGDSRKA
jgi:hypothetical protein